MSLFFIYRMNEFLFQSTKRKRKSVNEENVNSKLKAKRYRQGNVADEVPSKIILDEEEEEEEEEEPGEILDEDERSSIKPYQYTLFDEEKILSSTRHTIVFARRNKLSFFLFE